MPLWGHPLSGLWGEGEGGYFIPWGLRAQGLATGSQESDSPLAYSPAVLSQFLPFNKAIN